MTSRRLLIPAVLAAGAVLAPPAASAQQPTLQWDRPCYTDDQPMGFTGTGYTPDSPVDLLFSRPGSMIGGAEVVADAGGGIRGTVRSTAAQMLAKRDAREDIFVTGNDRTRIEQGAPPESQFAASSFTFTRWMGFSPGRYVPGRTAEVEAFGWAFAAGEPLYVLFQKGRTTVASVPAGRLDASCGDRVARVRVPRKLRLGSYRVVLSTKRREPSDLATWRSARVVKRASASAAAVGAMERG